MKNQLDKKQQSKVVDYFLIVEADVTHTGKEKKWNFPKVLDSKLKINIEGQEKKDVLDIVENLKAIALIENNTQGSQIEMQYNLNSGSANIELDKDFRILLNDDNMDKLVENCGKENIDFQYRAS